MERYQDNQDFIDLFRQKLSNLSDYKIKKLMSHGQYEAVGHSIHTADHDQCDDCYSGDTEYEMAQGIPYLGCIWKETAEELGLDVEAPVVYDSEDAEDDSAED